MSPTLLANLRRAQASIRYFAVPRGFSTRSPVQVLVRSVQSARKL